MGANDELKPKRTALIGSDNSLHDVWLSADVVAEVVRQANRLWEDGISNLQVQKMLYLCQCRHLVKFGVPLFSNAVIACQYGPVVRETYHALERHGASRIRDEHVRSLESWENSYPYERGGRVVRIVPETMDKDAIRTVFEEVSLHKGEPVWETVSQVCREGGAWWRTYRPDDDGGRRFGRKIPLEDMRLEGFWMLERERSGEVR